MDVGRVTGRAVQRGSLSFRERPNRFVVKGRKGSDSTRQNCSQLVWAAYRRQGINLETHDEAIPPGDEWGAGSLDKSFVTPAEIRQDANTRTYKRVYKKG